MTSRQHAYVEHRAAGLGQERAALAAGYARSSAKVSASRMERQPAIRKAIAAARKASRSGTTAQQEYAAESYLLAVVRGEEVPDPVRVGAARALLPYLQPRKRAPKKGATPRELDQREAAAVEEELLAKWAERAAKVRARLAKTTTRRNDDRKHQADADSVQADFEEVSPGAPADIR